MSTFSIEFIRIGLLYPGETDSARLSAYSYEQDHHLRLRGCCQYFQDCVIYAVIEESVQIANYYCVDYYCLILKATRR